MRHITILLLLLGIVASCKGKEETPAPQKEIPTSGLEIKTMHEWPLRDGLVLITSQPSAEAFAAMKANGIRTIINLRGADEMLMDEARLASENDLRYVHIPVQAATVTRNQARQFASQFTDKKAYPILVHCGSGNRAAMMMAIGEVMLYGSSPDAAIAKARERGMTSINLEKTVQALTGE
jgi:uncharacterized protein (TIGR01244 family)